MYSMILFLNILQNKLNPINDLQRNQYRHPIKNFLQDKNDPEDIIFQDNAPFTPLKGGGGTYHGIMTSMIVLIVVFLVIDGLILLYKYIDEERRSKSLLYSSSSSLINSYLL